jgi:hypothetical protein
VSASCPLPIRDRIVPPGVELGSAQVRPGDAILISGPIGDRGLRSWRIAPGSGSKATS